MLDYLNPTINVDLRRSSRYHPDDVSFIFWLGVLLIELEALERLVFFRVITGLTDILLKWSRSFAYSFWN